MSLESDIVATLGSLVDGRVFPDVAPFDTPRPYIIYQQIGGIPVSYVDNTIPNGGNAEVQVSVWDDTRLTANTLCRLAEDALHVATAFQARAMNSLSATHDEGTDRFGAQQDFSIWYAR